MPLKAQWCASVDGTKMNEIVPTLKEGKIYYWSHTSTLQIKNSSTVYVHGRREVIERLRLCMKWFFHNDNKFEL